MNSNKFSRRSAASLLVLGSTLAVAGAGFNLSQTASAHDRSQATLQRAASQHPADHGHETPHKIQHVVYIIMDNVHQSDIQQMPAVMKFLHQGTFFTNDHTILDSHTQDGMLSDMTGKYPSQTGVMDQGFFENGKYSGFAYWTATDPDGKPHVTTTPNWTTFNKHGWNVGAVGAPDMELESTKEVQPGYMNKTDTNPKDYLGVAVHNANGTTTFGSPNLPYVYNATSWSNPASKLAAFPGWSDNTDLNWSLQATYEMQTHGVPVTFTYLHDAHEVNGKQALPGTYQSTLKTYNQDLSTFFSKMRSAGLSPSNTLYVLTTDEGDQLMPNGELTTNLKGWLANNSLNQQNPDNLTIYGDSGALVYLKDQSKLPKTLASLTAVPGWNYVANKAELNALHMAVGSAPDRNPSFVLFSKPNVYYGTSGSTKWTYDTNYYWNHGTISPAILHIWLGIVGPGVKAHQTSSQWIDHADTMPTIYSLLGYNLTTASFDGVPAVTALQREQRYTRANFSLLHAEDVFKQLNAPVGEFGMSTLRMATQASVNATNSQGSALNSRIETLTAQRNKIAKQLQSDIFAALSKDPEVTGRLAHDSAQGQKLLNELKYYAEN